MKKRVWMFLGLFLALTVWTQGKATAQGEMVSKVDSDEFTYSGSLDDYTLCVSNCGAYYVTDLAGNMLLNVTYTFDLNQRPRPQTYYYSYDKEKVELYHTWQRPVVGYGDTIRLTDKKFIIHCVNNANIAVCLDNPRYVVQMPAETKLVSDGENITIMAEEGVKKGVHVGFYEFVTDTMRYDIGFSLDIDTVGSRFHFANGVLTYSLSKEQAFVIKAIKPEMEFYQFLCTKKAASGTIDLNSEELVWYTMEKEAQKNRPDTEKTKEKTVTLSWKKVPKARRYVVYQKTPEGFVKTATVKKCHCTVSITEDTVFKIKAQKKVKGRWKTLKTFRKEEGL